METAANIQSIVITNAIGLTLLVTLLVTGYLRRDRKRLDERIFSVLVMVCAGACILETATWVADGIAQPWAFFVNYLGNTYCYLATPAYAYLWVLYVDLHLNRSERILRQYWFLLVPTVAMMAAIVGNLFGHYLFTIDANNVYARTPLAYLNYAITFSSLFFSIWLHARHIRQNGPVRFFPIWMFLIPVFVGAGLQAAVFGISLAWTSVSIGLVAINMSLQNQFSYLDTLTNLYNRAYLDYALRTMEHDRTRRCGIMVDVDLFKGINDTYGHSTGDRALREIAHILSACAPADALTVRYAGDEFVMLLGSGDEDEATRVEEEVRAAVDAFNSAGGEPYDLSLSLGHGVYQPYEDTIDAFLQRIDERMYEDKRTKHMR